MKFINRKAWAIFGLAGCAIFMSGNIWYGVTGQVDPWKFWIPLYLFMAILLWSFIKVTLNIETWITVVLNFFFGYAVLGVIKEIADAFGWMDARRVASDDFYGLAISLLFPLYALYTRWKKSKN